MFPYQKQNRSSVNRALSGGDKFLSWFGGRAGGRCGEGSFSRIGHNIPCAHNLVSLALRVKQRFLLGENQFQSSKSRHTDTRGGTELLEAFLDVRHGCDIDGGVFGGGGRWWWFEAGVGGGKVEGNRAGLGKLCAGTSGQLAKSSLVFAGDGGQNQPPDQEIFFAAGGKSCTGALAMPGNFPLTRYSFVCPVLCRKAEPLELW